MPVAGKVSTLAVAAPLATITHTLTLTSVTGGTFRLGFHPGDETGNLAYNVSLADVKSALEGLLGISGTVTVTGTPGALYTISYAADTADAFLRITDDSVTGAGPEIEMASSIYDTSEDVGGRVDWNFNVDKTEIDGSHMDTTGGWSFFLKGRKNVTISGTARYIEEDTGQLALINNSFSDGDPMYFIFSVDDPANYTAPDTEIIRNGKGFVTNINPSPPDEDVTNLSFTIRLDQILEVQ